MNLLSFLSVDPLTREARHYGRVLVNKLEQLNICYRFPKSQKDFLEKGVSKVRFVRCVATPEALFYEIDSRRLPRGVKLADISDDNVLQDLSVACSHPVRFKYDVNGAWLILERDRGAFAIPSKLAFSDVLDAWPHKSLKPLLIPMGVGENRVIQFRSLAEMPHALVGGATGAGKTTFLHAMINALVLHNVPDDLRLVLVDLKGGTEFTYYKELPHMLHVELHVEEEDADGIHGFVKEPDDVPGTLEYLQTEMTRRLNKFEAAGGVRSITEWNYRHRTDHLPRIVLVIDELAVMMYDKALRKIAVPILADLTARGRAPGIHCVLATQRPEVRVVDGQIKGNTDARFAFRMTDNASSMVILDTAEAAKFDDGTPRGRFIYRRGIDRYEIQAPLVTSGQIREFVRGIIAGRSDSEMEEVAKISPEQVVRDALKCCEGTLAVTRLYQLYEGRVANHYLRDLVQNLEGEIVEIDGVHYEVQSTGTRRPRVLVPVDSR